MASVGKCDPCHVFVDHWEECACGFSPEQHDGNSSARTSLPISWTVWRRKAVALICVCTVSTGVLAWSRWNLKYLEISQSTWRRLLFLAPASSWADAGNAVKHQGWKGDTVTVTALLNAVSVEYKCWLYACKHWQPVWYCRAPLVVFMEENDQCNQTQLDWSTKILCQAMLLLPGSLAKCSWGSTRPQFVAQPRERGFFDPSIPGKVVKPFFLSSVLCCATRRKRSSRSLPTLKELRQKLKELGLPSSGRKADLLEALRQAVLLAEDPELELETEVLGAMNFEGPRETVDTETLRMKSSWQAKPISLEDDEDVIRPGDRIFLRAHTGCYIDVERDRAFARWDDPGGWQELVIEKSPLVIEDSDPHLFHPGDLIFLKAHTGCYLEVQDEGSPVQARWEDLGVWQGLELKKKNTDPLRVGDVVFLKSHTGMYVDVQGNGVQARWADEGDWQALTISRWPLWLVGPARLERRRRLECSLDCEQG